MGSRDLPDMSALAPSGSCVHIRQITPAHVTYIMCTLKLLLCGVEYGYNITFDSCNMGTSGLPDMYAQSPRAAGPRAEGIHIRQITNAHVTTIM